MTAPADTAARPLGFGRDWQRYRPVRWLVVALFGVMGAVAVQGDWAESALAAAFFGALGWLVAALSYPLFWLLCRLSEALQTRWPQLAASAIPAGGSSADAAAPWRAAAARSHGVRAADVGGAFAANLGPGVRLQPPDVPASPAPDTAVKVLPGVRWLAGEMQTWREALRQRLQEPSAEAGVWTSYDEAAGALQWGVRPAIQRLAAALSALSEAALAAPADGPMPVHQAALFEAALWHWADISQGLRARRFAGDPVGTGRLHAIVQTLDARLLRALDAYIDLSHRPKAVLPYANIQGQVLMEVDFDCAAEVRAFAEWA
ncbi:hypothetical protein, partial [Tepidimonas sp.]|uniref:hypothetical protein n=1 Tax=Tepidimonas sp. TaxID=2002775 RepID=UPI002FE1A454